VSKCKFSKSDYEALNRKTVGIYYPPDQGQAQVRGGRRKPQQRKGRRS